MWVGTESTGLCSLSCPAVRVQRQPSGVVSPWGISGYGLHITFEVQKESDMWNKASTAKLGPSKLGGLHHFGSLWHADLWV